MSMLNQRGHMEIGFIFMCNLLVIPNRILLYLSYHDFCLYALISF